MAAVLNEALPNNTTNFIVYFMLVFLLLRHGFLCLLKNVARCGGVFSTPLLSRLC